MQQPASQLRLRTVLGEPVRIKATLEECFKHAIRAVWIPRCVCFTAGAPRYPLNPQPASTVCGQGFVVLEYPAPGGEYSGLR